MFARRQKDDDPKTVGSHDFGSGKPISWVIVFFTLYNSVNTVVQMVCVRAISVAGANGCSSHRLKA